MSQLYGHVLETIFLGFIRRDALILQRIDAFEGDLKVRGESLVFAGRPLATRLAGSY
jgi:hypothetical protein